MGPIGSHLRADRRWWWDAGSHASARSDRVLRVGEVMKLTGLGRTTIWELEPARRVSEARAAGQRAQSGRWLERVRARCLDRAANGGALGVEHGEHKQRQPRG